MKKIGLFLLSAFIMTIPAYALTPDEAREAQYQEMKQIKQKQREAKEARKKAITDGTIEPKKETFWDRERKRSGLGETGAGIGAVIKNLNPVPFFREQQDKYNARKTGSVQ